MELIYKGELLQRLKHLNALFEVDEPDNLTEEYQEWVRRLIDLCHVVDAENAKSKSASDAIREIHDYCDMVGDCTTCNIKYWCRDT